MAETGCLKDGHFNNLQVENTTILGGTFGLAPTGQSFGVYEGTFELKFGATTGGSTTITTTDNGLIKTVATLPANATILDAAIITSEAFDSNDDKGMDLVMTSTSPASADTAIDTNVIQVITAFEAKNTANGAIGQGQGMVGNPHFIDGGAGTHLVLINTDDSNTGHAIQTGKVVVYIKYAGNAAPVANTSF